MSILKSLEEKYPGSTKLPTSRSQRAADTSTWKRLAGKKEGKSGRPPVKTPHGTYSKPVGGRKLNQKEASGKKDPIAASIPTSGGREYEAQQSIVASIPTSTANMPRTPKVSVRGMTPQSKEAQQTISGSLRSGTDTNVDMKSLVVGKGRAVTDPSPGQTTKPKAPPVKEKPANTSKAGASDFLSGTEYEDLRYK